MHIRDWDARYCERQTDPESAPTPLLIEMASRLRPGDALDVACGTGRNALWLAEHGWNVTAVDGSPAAIEILRSIASERALPIDARVADLEKFEYRIEPSSWDLIAMCYYLQRDLIEPAKLGLAADGVLLTIVHIADPGEEPSYKRLKPGELDAYFLGWQILHRYEGKPKDVSHQRSVSEIVARRPTSPAHGPTENVRKRQVRR